MEDVVNDAQPVNTPTTGNSEQDARSSPWLDVADAAAYLRLSVHTLNTYRSRHTGPSYHKAGGRRVLYHVADLDAWMQENRVRVGR